VAELRGEDDVVTSSDQRLTYEVFAAALRVAVQLGGVEKSDPVVDGRVEHGLRPLQGLRRSAGPGEVVASQTDRTHDKVTLTKLPLQHHAASLGQA
jgi:hypothetical protein